MIDEFRDFRSDRYSVESGIFCDFATCTCTGIACIAPAAAASPPAEVLPQPTAPAATADTASAITAMVTRLCSCDLNFRLSVDSNIRPRSPVGTRLCIHRCQRLQGRNTANSKSYANLAALPRRSQTVTELDASQKIPLLLGERRHPAGVSALRIETRSVYSEHYPI